MASISVKVPTAKVITMLEDKIWRIKSDIVEYPALRQKYEQDLQAYKAQVAEFVADYLGKHLDQIGYGYDSIIRISDSYAGSKLELSFDKSAIAGFPEKPQEPQKPNERSYFGREYITPLEVLESTLKTLRMTEQETINASTYANVMKLL